MDERRYRGEIRPREHSLSLVNREKLTMTGVTEVLSFDDREIILSTEQGTLTLRGEGLHIRQLDLESGNFTVEGHVTSVVYSAPMAAGSRRRGKGLLERILR